MFVDRLVKLIDLHLGRAAVVIDAVRYRRRSIGMIVEPDGDLVISGNRHIVLKRECTSGVGILGVAGAARGAPGTCLLRVCIKIVDYSCDHWLMPEFAMIVSSHSLSWFG